MTAAQAVECLGRAVHVGVARQLVLRLAAEGVLSTGLTYGSAFSGIDTFAAGVDQVFGEDWRRTTLDTMTLSRLSRRIGSQTQVEIRSTRHAVEHQRSENIIWVVHGSLGLM